MGNRLQFSDISWMLTRISGYDYISRDYLRGGINLVNEKPMLVYTVIFIMIRIGDTISPYLNIYLIFFKNSLLIDYAKKDC